MTGRPIDGAAIEAAVAADPGHPRGRCIHCGGAMPPDPDQGLCEFNGNAPCELPTGAEIVAGDRAALLARVQELEATNRELHRRAQRLEGVDARLERVRAGYERLIAWLYLDAWRQRRGAHRRFRTVYDALAAAGYAWGTKMPGTRIPGTDRECNAEAPALVGMLAADRDQQRERAAAAEAEVARWSHTVGAPSPGMQAIVEAWEHARAIGLLHESVGDGR
jgi:hypothetical protein